VGAYHVYEQAGTNWTRLASTTNTLATLTNVVAGVHTYAVTATNTWGESLLSNPVSTQPAAGVPTGVRVVVTVDIAVQ
jgi:hypothetical protein